MMSSHQRILVNGDSDVLRYILAKASHKGIPLTLYILESRPNCEGYRMFKELKALNIDCTLITDGSVGVILEKVDYVVTGAKVVTENGGVINTMGTYTLAICAKAMKKPVYAFAENYKFMRTFILNQKDIPQTQSRGKVFPLCKGQGIPEVSLGPDEVCGAANDFTPSDLIAYIVSDSRIFKSSGVSDEFLQTFNF